MAYLEIFRDIFEMFTKVWLQIVVFFTIDFMIFNYNSSLFESGKLRNHICRRTSASP